MKKNDKKSCGTRELTKVVAGKNTINELASSGPLFAVFDDLRLMYGMVRDYCDGSYRRVPFGTIAAVAGALLYVISPVDAIPDVLPLVGLTDDLAVVMACMKAIQADLKKYERWRDR